jgi:hypothetical protein
MLQRPAFKATFVVVCLTIFFCVLSLSAVRQKSPTFDETLHLFAGYSYLKWGDFGINPEHPPLAKMVAALPLLALQLSDRGLDKKERDLVQRDRSHAWELANRFLFLYNDADSVFFYAKFSMMLFALALGLVVHTWARELYGLGAASVALFLFFCDPNIIAHSTLVHTDIPFALFFVAATYFFWRSLNHLSWPNLLLTSTCFALAAITKFSFVTIVPIWVVLGLVKIFAKVPQRSGITKPELVTSRWGKAGLLIILLGAALLTCYLVIWLTYGLRFDAAPYPRAQLPSLIAAAKKPWLEQIVGFSSDYLFFPDSWIFGIADAFRSLDRPAYLLGEIAKDGFWLYFPIAFLAKTPLPTLILILVGLVYLIFSKNRLPGTMFLLIPVICFFAAAVWSHINIGIRHILPLYPFLFVWLGGVAAALWARGSRSIRCALLLLAFWTVGSPLAVHPDYLPFFNEAVGGPDNGHKILVDSNLDWGQDLKGLKAWMERNKVEKIQLAYFGTANPIYYGIDADYLPGTLFPRPSENTHTSRKATHVAVSATYLMGYNLLNPNAYSVLRQQTPVAVIGHSIWVFKLQS